MEEERLMEGAVGDCNYYDPGFSEKRGKKTCAGKLKLPVRPPNEKISKSQTRC